MSELLSVADLRDRLAKEMERAGSQAAWARQHGIERSYVNRFVAGQRIPTERLLKALSIEKALGMRDAPQRARAPKRTDRARRSPLKMSDLLNVDAVRELLAQQVQRAGSQSAWAKEMGVAQSSVSHCLIGRRRPTRPLLKALKLKNVVAYRQLRNKDDAVGGETEAKALHGEEPEYTPDNT
jgi:DNA-binding transcriptional regulator YdaS (Cro superfamily)